MDREKLLLILLALTSILLLQEGITGFTMMDFTQNTCTMDSDCENVCCPVYGESYGLCDKENNCAGIYQATREVSQQYSSLTPTQLKTEVRQVSVEQNYVAVSLGLILAAIVVIIAYFERKHKKPKK